MKTKIFLLTITLAAIATSCKNDDEPKAFAIKATDMIAIRPLGMAAKAPSVAGENGVAHMSALEIVKQASAIMYKHSGETWSRSFTDELRDLTTPKLMMWATDVITLDGGLQTELIEATDVLIVTYETIYSPSPKDTIAYMPNATLRTAETAIRAAYAAKDIDACYSVFNTAYTFVPVTGAEWKALKKAGQN